MRNGWVILLVLSIAACQNSGSTEVYRGSADLSESDTGMGHLPVFKGVQGRLTVSKEELALWKRRAENGPYKLPGDAGAHTPGDWKRIQEYTEDFIRSPFDSGNTDAERLDIWTGYSQQVDSLDEYPIWQGIKMEAAAFSFLVTGNDKAGQAAKNTLLTQIRLPDAPHRVGYPVSIWKVPAGNNVKPTFESGTKECVWLMRLALTYDYVLPLLSTAERREVVAYLRGAAWYFAKRAQRRLEGIFPERNNSNYAKRTYLADPKGVPQFGAEPIYAPSDEHDPPSYGTRLYTHVKADGHLGNPISRLALQYNNRIAERMAFVLLAGLLSGDEYLIKQATLYQKEWLMFSVYPDGTYGEYERNGDYGNPSQGAMWYGSLCLQSYVLSGHWLQRAGRENLFTFSSKDGAHGTQMPAAGPPKNLQTVFKRYTNNLRGIDPIYYGDTGLVNRIDGDNESPLAKYSTRHCTWDYLLAVANKYYHNPLYKAIYLRKAPGTLQYPAKGYTSAAKIWLPWCGTGAEMPGWLFMYAEE